MPMASKAVPSAASANLRHVTLQLSYDFYTKVAGGGGRCGEGNCASVPSAKLQVGDVLRFILPVGPEAMLCFKNYKDNPVRDLHLL